MAKHYKQVVKIIFNLNKPVKFQSKPLIYDILQILNFQDKYLSILSAI